MSAIGERDGSGSSWKFFIDYCVVKIGSTSSPVFRSRCDPKKAKAAELFPEIPKLSKLIILVNLIREWSEFFLCKIENSLT